MSATYRPFAKGYGIFFGIVIWWAVWLAVCWAALPVFHWIHQAVTGGGEGA
jgi:hypothetical protein